MKYLLLTNLPHINFHKKKTPGGMNEPGDLNNHRLNHRRYVSPIFGRTLEVSLIPSKICAFDCIYCKYGRTTHKTIDYIEHIPAEKAVHELETVLLGNRDIDHIVICGKGDPALYGGLSTVIKGIKKTTRTKVAVVPCSGLLWKHTVQADLSGADVVMASLDSSDKTLYQSINRPHGMVPFTRFFNGMLEFRRIFKGEFWLQVTLLDGMNAVETDVRKIAKLAESLFPDRTFIRTVEGEPVEEFAFPVEHSRLQKFAEFFRTKAVVIHRDELPPLPVSAHDGLPLGMHD